MVLLALALLSPRLVSASIVADARRVADAISRSAGVSVTFAPDVRIQTLTVEIHSKPLADVLHHLAYATFTRIKQVENGYVLESDRAEQSRAISEFHAFIISSLRRTEAQRYEKYVKVPLGGKTRKPGSTQPVRPTYQALASLLHDIPPERLMRPGHELIVFSDRPVGEELKLDLKSVSKALALYTQGRADEGDAPMEGIKRLLLVLRRTDSLADPTAELMLLDSDGNALDSCGLPLLDWPPKWPIPLGVLNSISEKDPVVLAKDTIAVMSTVSTTDEQFSKWRDPLNFDPQNFVQADIWKSIAYRANRDLMMCLPDQLVVHYQFDLKSLVVIQRQAIKKITLRDAAQDAWRRSTRVDSNWISFRQPDPEVDKPWQWDRSRLMAWIRANDKNPDSVFAEKATFFYASKLSDVRNPFGYLWYVAREHRCERTPIDFGMGLMQFYGSLSEAQRSRLISGNLLAALDLSAESKRLLVRYLEQNVMEPVKGQRNTSANQFLLEVAPNGIAGATLALANYNNSFTVALPSGFESVGPGTFER